MKRLILITMVLLLLMSVLAGCRNKETPTPEAAAGGVPADAMAIAQARGLTPDDINAALKTYVPSGKWDDYYLFTSGGHSGNLIVIGVPSMRTLKNIAVFTPEAWQGYGIGELGTERFWTAATSTMSRFAWATPIIPP